MKIQRWAASITLMFLFIPIAHARQSGSASRFEGEWVGLQSWTVENPSAREPQTVTVTLAVSGDELTGALTPALGSAEGVPLTDITIEGNEVRAAFDFSGVRNRWQRGATGTLTLTMDGENMTGTANLAMGDVPWLVLEYDLSRKRARYGGNR